MKRLRFLKSWLLLGLGILGLAALVTVLHLVSPALPGMTGRTLRNNIEKNIEATALVYTESGDVNDYLDPENGKYYLKRR